MFLPGYDKASLIGAVAVASTVTFDKKGRRQASLGSKTLRKYAGEILTKCYSKALRRTSIETGIPVDKFPKTCPYSVDRLLTINK